MNGRSAYVHRGDTKALVADIIEIDRAGHFEQRATLFHFLRDLSRPIGEYFAF